MKPVNEAIVNSTEVKDSLYLKAKRKDLVTSFMPFAGLIFISLFMIIVTKGAVIKQGNLLVLLNQVFTISLVGVGAAFVYSHGGFDFSIGASNGLAQYICVLIIVQKGLPIWLGILAAVLIGVTDSVLVGGLSALIRVNPFVTSLCMRSICMGLLSMAVNGSGGQINVSYQQFAMFDSWVLKLAVLFVVILCGYYLFEKTSLGKSGKAIGGNLLTSVQSGIKVNRTMVLSYALLGFCVGLAAIFQVARLGIITTQSGSGLEFDLMVAIILGGFPMAGGAGAKLLSVIIGACTITILANGLIIWGLDVNVVNGIKGLLFVIIIAISYDRSSVKQVNITT